MDMKTVLVLNIGITCFSAEGCVCWKPMLISGNSQPSSNYLHALAAKYTSLRDSIKLHHVSTHEKLRHVVSFVMLLGPTVGMTVRM
jgi:hypothetical protein